MGGHVVKMGAANFYDADGNHMTAYKGETVEDVCDNLKDGEIERLEKAGVFEDPTAAETLTTPAGVEVTQDQGEQGDDLDSMQVADLRARADAVGVSGADSMKKPELVKAIRAAAPQPEAG
jgi:hypothetical protein